MTSHDRRRLAAEPWRRVYSTERWKRTRVRVRRRAGGVCERCGREAKTLDVHHRIALKDGGPPYDMDNLEALCRPCHRSLEHAGGSFLGSAPPTSLAVGISLPDRRKGRNSPRDSANAGEKQQSWVSPNGSVVARLEPRLGQRDGAARRRSHPFLASLVTLRDAYVAGEVGEARRSIA
jgi:HNH endonuclease